VDAAALEGALRWLDDTVETELLMNEIEDATARISTLVGVAKQYSQLELNQVWTNLIDNAVSAMGEAGVLTVRTGLDQGQVSVDICDTGPGVPLAIRERIFEPFYTTKPVGQGRARK
jgi:signal transduction histidine kinase